jgi:hypothetical protein
LSNAWWKISDCCSKKNFFLLLVSASADKIWPFPLM